MSNYAVIAQNDESEWDDVKGESYHYPATYQTILTPGCRVVYYTGEMRKSAYASQRLSPKPHYFGVATIGDSTLDPHSTKKDRYCQILDYRPFKEAVLAKIDGLYLEDIPESKAQNYWRFGVREATSEVYERIAKMARLTGYTPALPHPSEDFESYHQDGNKKFRYTSHYERNAFYRNKAIAIHGLVCMACGMDFAKAYGEWGAGYIHVHHNKPVSETGSTRPDPETDLSVVCPNCHAMIHRKRDRTLSLEEVKRLLDRRP